MKHTLSRTQESNVQTVFGGDKEVTWLSSTAWNMGYNAAKVDDYEGTYQFLSIAYQVYYFSWFSSYFELTPCSC